MGLRRDDRLMRVERDDLATLALTPQDFFLASRVDGTKPRVSEILASSGLPTEQAEATLLRLVELGVLKVLRPESERSGLRGSVAERQARQLRAAFERGVPGASSVPGSRPPPSSVPRSRPGASSPDSRRAPEASAVPNSETSGLMPPPGSQTEAPMADTRDERLDPSLDIPVERQREILGLYDRLGTANHFEILSITPTSEVPAIRRAYHKLSRRLHPDAFYGKKIGPFGEMVSELFKAARASHDLLVSSEQREAYVERLLEIERRKLAAVEARSREAARRRELQRALERQREEAIEAKRLEKERAERAVRDKARKERIGRRLVGNDGRDKKAKEHIAAAEAELAAGHHGAAAGLFRLAMDLLPDDQELMERWKGALETANKRRAAVALDKANHLVATGDAQEAAHYYEEAARSVPSAMNLALAAAHLALRANPRAHQRAREAIDALRASEGAIPERDAAEVLVLCAETYLRLGQLHTAGSHAEQARKRYPKHPRLRVLLKKLKVG